MTKALLVMDFINEIVGKEGKLAKNGYLDFISENNTFEKLNSLIKKAKEKDLKIIFVKLAFKKDYSDQLKNSLIQGKAHEYNILQNETPSTEFIPKIQDIKYDKLIVKNRISSFSNKELDEFLKQNNISEVYLAGVSTDLVVLSTAFDAHDLGYNVFVVGDACAAPKQEMHIGALNNMKKFCKVISVEEL